MSENLLPIIEVAELVRQTSGKNDKKDILTANKDNKLLIDALSFVLNPYIKTGIQLKKLDKPFKSEESFNDLYELMDYLKKYSTGRGEDIGRVQNYMKSLKTLEEQEFIKQLVTETFKIGVSAKTMNKVFGEDTVPVFELQAANNLKDLSDKFIVTNFFISLKLDGNRCAIFKEDGKLLLRSRSGQVMEGFVELEEHLAGLKDGYMFDGELLIHDYDKSISSRERFQLTQKIVRKKGPKKNIEYNIFDMVPIEEFKAGVSSLTYTERRKQLDAIEQNELLKVVPIMYEGTDMDVISELLGEVLANNLEGLMINFGDTFYRTKRSNDILKVKGILSGDGLVTGVYQGKKGGRNENRLGGLYITYKDVVVRVGGGYSDEQRDLFWEDPASIIGKVVEYNYTEESENDKGETDLRYSRFVTIRDDKTEDNLNYE